MSRTGPSLTADGPVSWGLYGLTRARGRHRSPPQMKRAGEPCRGEMAGLSLGNARPTSAEGFHTSMEQRASGAVSIELLAEDLEPIPGGNSCL